MHARGAGEIDLQRLVGMLSLITNGDGNLNPRAIIEVIDELSGPWLQSRNRLPGLRLRGNSNVIHVRPHHRQRLPRDKRQQLIRPLLASTETNNDSGWVSEWSGPLREAIQAELRHVLKQQADQGASAATDNASRWITALLGNDLAHPALTPRDFIHFWMAWAFLNRITESTRT